MGRAALGAAAKTKTGGVRVTEAENAKFVARYGSLGKFLQLKVAEELRRMDTDKHSINPRQELK